MGQRFRARERFAFSNGAIGWRPGGPFDCVGPYAKVENCPLVVLVWFPYPGKEDATRYPVGSPGVGLWRHVDSGERRTCYATGYADTFFSVPACTRLRGKHVRGYFTDDSGTYRERDGSDRFVGSAGADGCVFMVSSEWAKLDLLARMQGK